MIEDVDLLLTTSQHVIYHLFEWPDRPHTKLIVLAISNPKDLPERFKTKASSRAGLQRFHFSPYTTEQLGAIITTRLGNLIPLDNVAVEFLAKRVASINVDVRQVLSLCQYAVDLASKEWLSLDDTSAPLIHVELRHVQNAVAMSSTSPSLTLLRSKSVMEKLFLAALMRCKKNRKITTLADIAKDLALLSVRSRVTPPIRRHVLDICNALAMTRCIEMDAKEDGGSGGGDMMLRSIDTDHDAEIMIALKEDPLTRIFF